MMLPCMSAFPQVLFSCPPLVHPTVMSKVHYSPYVVWFSSLLWLFILVWVTSVLSAILPIDQATDSAPATQVLFFGLVLAGDLWFLVRLSHVRWVGSFRFANSLAEVQLGPLLFRTAHHPTNDPSSKHHELSLGSLRICAGCYGLAAGLAFGTVVVPVGVVLLSPPSPVGPIFVGVGILATQLALAKYLPINPLARFPLVRFFHDLLLSLGLHLVLVGVFGLSGSVFACALTLLGLFPLLGSRLFLSREL